MKGAAHWLVAFALLACLPASTGCARDEAAGGEARGGPGRGGGPGSRGGGATAAVPVEVAAVVRRSIASYIETNGTLEAENEVDIVSRTADPIVELLVEEGDRVERGQLLVRLDDAQHRADLEIARVTLNETEMAFNRAKRLQDEQLISPESYEQAQSSYETARAQVAGLEIQLGHTRVHAPFDGHIIARYVNLAEQVSVNMPLLRISDFDPLLCPIQVPERELPRLRKGQRAYLTVESFPGERFGAEVLRIRPVVDSATGTIKVTLKVDARRRLRPGMFARVYLETDVRSGALVIPKAALSLETIGDTVYVAADGLASRREVELGFREGDFVEVVSGVAEGDLVVVVGQDGLSDGTPIQAMDGTGAALAASSTGPGRRGDGPSAGGGPQDGGGRRGRPDRPDFSQMTPEQLERVKERMRGRGMTEEQIDERLGEARKREGAETNP